MTATASSVLSLQWVTARPTDSIVAAQLVPGSQVALRWPISPWEREVKLARRASSDVPDRKPPLWSQHSASLFVQASFVGHVHLHVLAHHNGETG